MRAWVEAGDDNPNRTFTVKSCDDTVLTFADGTEVTVNKYLEANGVLNTSKGTAPTTGSTAGMNSKVGLPSFAFNTTVPGTCYVKIKKEGTIAETCRHRIVFATASSSTTQSSASAPDGTIEELSYEVNKAGSFFIYDVSGSGKFSIYAVRFVPKYQEVTIGSTGYATIGNTTGQHLAKPEGVSVYSARATSSTTVTLTSVTAVRAGEGYVVKGTPGTYKFYATATDPGASQKGGEMVRVKDAIVNFPASVDETEDEVTTTYYQYILAADGGTAKFFAPDGTSTLAAGKAYLKTTTSLSSGGARGFDIVIEGETTAINSVATKPINDGKYYNLQGIEVAQPTKGLYIVNGKKVIIK